MTALRRTLAALCATALTAGAARAGEWPRFMGPSATGIADAGERIARSWPADGPRQLWRIETGPGFGGAAIARGKVYLLDRRGKDQDVFRVLDLKTGETLWEHAYVAGAPDRGGYPGTRSTPTIDGDRAYTVGRMGHVHCFDLVGKTVLWSKSLPGDFGAKSADWGFAQSPLIVREKVILSTAGGSAGVVALNKDTGETAWKTEAFGHQETYNSPMLVTIDGDEQIVMWHRGMLAAFSAADGAKRWTYAWRTRQPIPQPVALGDGRVFLTIGYGGGCAMLRVLKEDGNRWTVTELFHDDRTASKVPPALLYDGHIYTNSHENRNGLQCLDASGNLKWQTGAKPEFGQGSMIIADGVIFIVDAGSGDLVMVQATPDGYKELGRARLLGGRDIWAPLALSDGMLVLRDQGQMKCVYVGTGG